MNDKQQPFVDHTVDHTAFDSANSAPAPIAARQAAFACLMIDDPLAKIDAVQALAAASSLQFEPVLSAERVPVPGRPAKPELLHPAKVPRRGLGSVAGRIGFFHALAHIEFNAINLALDAVYRFDAMPAAFYHDWLSVAADEARHFLLLREYLQALGAEYGDLPAHDGLWQMTHQTDYDVMVRMALVPRVLEARGLDVAPKMIRRLREMGDERGVELLTLIQSEEIVHVRIGNRWFLHCCEARGVEPTPTFKSLLAEHGRDFLAGPFNRPARLEAGFSEQDLDLLETLESEFRQELRQGLQ